MEKISQWILASFLLVMSTSLAVAAPLSCWNDGASKQAIIDFVQRVSDPEGKDFVPPAERIAVFDNDGTLWVEQPVYTQLAFALDRLKQLAPQHPEWANNPALKAALDGDLEALTRDGHKGLLELVMATHAGMTPDEFQKVVMAWLATAEHPRFKMKYTDLVYQPMLELMAYLRENGFTTYIVSGGGIEFMRPWTEQVYGISPAQVVGSSIQTKFEIVDGKPQLIRQPHLNFIDDNAGKPVGINQHIGQRPIAAFGNSDGDLQMLQWTTAGEKPSLGLIVHHTDAEREYAYDRESTIGRLDKALDAAPGEGWVVVDMKNDWKTVFKLAGDLSCHLP